MCAGSKARRNVFLAGRIAGADSLSRDPPLYVLESRFLHVLLQVEVSLRDGLRPDYIYAKAGNWRAVSCLANWFTWGTLGLESSAASDICDCIRTLSGGLSCSAILEAVPGDFFEDARFQGTRDSDIVFATACRLFRSVFPRARQQ